MSAASGCEHGPSALAVTLTLLGVVLIVVVWLTWMHSQYGSRWWRWRVTPKDTDDRWNAGKLPHSV